MQYVSISIFVLKDHKKVKRTPFFVNNNDCTSPCNMHCYCMSCYSFREDDMLDMAVFLKENSRLGSVYFDN